MRGYVYLICDPANDAYKIGVTRTLKSKRIKKLQTGNPTELHIVHIYETEYPFRLEKMLHTHFVLKHILNEWYSLDAKDIVNFSKTCEKLCGIIESLKENPFFAKDLR